MWKKEIFVGMPIDGRKANKGRPPKMMKRDERLLLCTITWLRNANTSFAVQTLQNEAGVKHVSKKTVYYFRMQRTLFIAGIKATKYKYKYLP